MVSTAPSTDPGDRSRMTDEHATATKNPYGYETGVPGGEVVRQDKVPVPVEITSPSQVFFLGAREQWSLCNEMGTQIVRDRSVLYDPSVPLVVAVGDGQAIARLHTLMEQSRPVSAVIAWRLPEELLPRLLALDVPILMGIPTTEELLAAVNDGKDNIDRDVERDRAARLAVREALFEKPAVDRA